MKLIRITLVMLMVLGVGSSYCIAGSVDVPNVFTPSTPARADSVNENFSALEIAVDDNAAMISSLQNAISETTTGYYWVSPVTAVPMDETADYSNWWPGVVNSDGTNADFWAPVHLPNGATVTELVLYFFDSDLHNGATIKLWQVSAWGDSNDSMSDDISSTGLAANGSASGSSFNPSLIDNENNRYALQITLPSSSTIFRSARISYVSALK